VPPWNHAVFVRAKNLPFSAAAVKNGRFQLQDLCGVKPQFYRNGKATLIKSMKPMERLSFDFKGPVPSRRGNTNLLIVIDEYSRFRFVFPCIDMTALTVIRCLEELLTLYGTASLIHSYNGPAFTSKEFKRYLLQRGTASSFCSVHHPSGNGQVERTVRTVCTAISKYNFLEFI